MNETGQTQPIGFNGPPTGGVIDHGRRRSGSTSQVNVMRNTVQQPVVHVRQAGFQCDVGRRVDDDTGTVGPDRFRHQRPDAGFRVFQMP